MTGPHHPYLLDDPRGDASRLGDTLLAAWPVELREHVSASSLTMFARCPQQWHFRYVCGLKERPRQDLVWGSAHHATIEENYEQKIVSQKDLSIAEIKERFAFLLEKEVDERGGASEIDWKDDGEGPTDPQTAFADVKDRGVRLIEAYQKVAAPRVQPIAVEREFVQPLPGFPVPLKGRIDLEAHVKDPFRPEPKWMESEECRQCGRDLLMEPTPVQARGLCSWCAGDLILDTKTAAQDKLQPDSRLQGWMYQLERALPVDFTVCVKPKNAEAQPKISFGKHIVPVQPRARTLAWAAGMMRGIAYYIATYGGTGTDEDLPWPTHALRDTWACDYCGFGPKGTNRCVWHQDGVWLAQDDPFA